MGVKIYDLDDLRKAYIKGKNEGRADAIAEFKDLGKLYSEIRADAIDECKKIVMEECVSTCEYPFHPNCIECMTNKMEQLKEQNE